MKRTLTTLALGAMFAVAGTASAQQTTTQSTQPTTSTMQQTGPKADIPPRLAAKAKIAESAARATAMSRVPGSTVEAAELENENGKLLYSYDLKVAGQSGIQEVQVDAITGNVIGVVHETPADIRKEAAADRKAAWKSHHGKRHSSEAKAEGKEHEKEGSEKPEL